MKEIVRPTGWKPGLRFIMPNSNPQFRGLLNSVGDSDPSTFGYEYVVKTTSYLRTQVVKQKFYEVAPADFMSVIVGEGAYLNQIVQKIEYTAGGNFETGCINIGANSAQVPIAQIALNNKTYPIVPWNYGYDYTTYELENALAANNWDIVEGKTKAVKKIWDLGIQKIAFLGSKTLQGVYGIYNLPDPTVDTTTLTKSLSSMNPAEFQTFVGSMLGLFYANANSAMLPDTLIIPALDMLGLTNSPSPLAPFNSKLDYMQRAFEAAIVAMGGSGKFIIRATSYGDQARNAGVWATNGTNRYILYKNDPEVVRLDIPQDFMLMSPGTIDQLKWKGGAQGQFTGVQNYIPRGVYYFDWAA